ncbi:hypothetical protein P4C99_19805 [Pontiellaceae bacterium B1224]|nr:hypothetical protein [Pontiellaceae bacterium B1224]
MEDPAKETAREESGPWPFITRRLVQLENGGEELWRSRHHRKGLPLARRPDLKPWPWLWMPGELNWWIGTVFALGSLLFAVGSILWLFMRAQVSESLINAVFFAGSIPFTTAAYLQLFQAANAGREKKGRSTVRFGWKPRDIGWLSCAIQFAGTLLFNVNTFDAMLPNLNWWRQDILIWIPDAVGSILFFISGYLAYAETCHAHWGWKPRSLSWWVTFVNLLGCAAFLVSAVFAFVPEHQPQFNAARWGVVFTLIGAIGFFAGSVLMLPESTYGSEESG